MLLSSPRNQTPAMPHSRHIGTIKIIAVDRAKLSYSAECVSHTKKMHNGNTKSAVFAGELLLKCQLGPFEFVSAAGRFSCARVSMIPMASPLLEPGALLPLISADSYKL